MTHKQRQIIKHSKELYELISRFRTWRRYMISHSKYFSTRTKFGKLYIHYNPNLNVHFRSCLSSFQNHIMINVSYVYLLCIFLWNICEKGETRCIRRCVFDKAYTNELTRQMCFGWTLSFNWLINSFSSWADAKSFFSILYYVSVKLEASFINTPIIVIVYGSSWRVVFWGIILIAEI